MLPENYSLTNAFSFFAFFFVHQSSWHKPPNKTNYWFFNSSPWTAEHCEKSHNQTSWFYFHYYRQCVCTLNPAQQLQDSPVSVLSHTLWLQLYIFISILTLQPSRDTLTLRFIEKIEAIRLETLSFSGQSYQLLCFFPGSSDGRQSARNVGDLSSIP